MKILLVSQNYLPFIGGVETHIRQIAHEYQHRGHDVCIIAMNFGAFRGHPRFAMLHTSLLAPTHPDGTDGPIPIYSLAPRSGVERLRLAPIALRALPKIQRWLYHPLHRLGFPAYSALIGPCIAEHLEGVDVVHSLAGDYLGWTAQQEADRRGIPFVCTPFVHPQQWGDGPDDAAFYKRCAGVIGLVPTDSAYLQSLGVPAKKIHTIGVSPELPETVDGEGFRERHGLGNLPVVLYVGRMMVQKGARAVVEAAPKVWMTRPETQFLFIGPGSPEEIAIFEGADPRMKYLGKVSAQEKGDALAACDVFCMPSMSEILPTVYLEAWSLGKPIVGGMAHGLPELLVDSGGGLCAEQNGEAVAVALQTLLGNPAKRTELGEAGRKLVEQKYSTQAVVDQLEALYGALVQKKGAMRVD
ncbi:glycosyltransferase family 4 protein [Armatimonas sp.]|uniref:glycosyltransferase family 4 protein n=1 Tax=Armatimonas sp. TaxID=1872638 RepID=UPI003751F332